MEIKIENYLSEDEMKEIAITIFKDEIHSMFRKENTLVNIIKLLSKKIIFEEINKNLPDSEDFIAKKVAETIHNYDYADKIFSTRGMYTDDLGLKIIKNVINKNKDFISLETEKVIKSNDYSKTVNNIIAIQIEDFIDILNKIKP